MNLALDMGGTNIRACIFDDNGIQKTFKSSSAEIGLAGFIEKIVQKQSVKKIGISYAGQVQNGVIIDSPNIEVDILDIKEYFKTKYGIKLFIENDLTCAAIAEANYLKSDFVCALYIGTGLGLGVVDVGKILKGSTNLSAEIGHIPYKTTPLRCGCGRDNCIELFSSGNGIKKWIEYLNLTCNPTLEALKIDRKGKKIADGFEIALTYATGTAITLYNPQILVLGGGIIDANPYLLDLIKSKISEYTLKPTLDNCKIIKSSLKDAPLKGAMLLHTIKDES